MIPQDLHTHKQVIKGKKCIIKLCLKTSATTKLTRDIISFFLHANSVFSLQCAILSPIFRVRDFSITDCQPYAIQLSWQGSIDEDRYAFLA